MPNVCTGFNKLGIRFICLIIVLGIGYIESKAEEVGPPLDSCEIYLKSGISHATMQGMDVNRQGQCYMSWEEQNCMHVRKIGAYEPDMILPTGGHGDCFFIEQRQDSCMYFWTSGSLGEGNGGYRGGQALDDDIRLICKYKYKPGALGYPENAEECYYLNNNGCRMVDVDEKDSILVCWTYEDGLDYIITYRMSDMIYCTPIECVVSRTFHKGETVRALNLNSITPLSRFSWNRNVTCGTTNGYPKAVQGLCADGGKIYILTGYKHDSASALSILDYSGKLLTTCAELAFTKEKNKLIEKDVTSDGTFEPEGIHIHDGNVYIGFVGDYPEKGTAKHSCIIRTKL